MGQNGPSQGRAGGQPGEKRKESQIEGVEVIKDVDDGFVHDQEIVLTDQTEPNKGKENGS